MEKNYVSCCNKSRLGRACRVMLLKSTQPDLFLKHTLCVDCLSIDQKSQIVATDIGTLPGSSRHTEDRVAGKRTVSAYAEGLTCVQIQGDERDESEGNVFTGALPPWLQKDKTSDKKGCIGPTIEDYEKHLERVRKSKLPATRVGAKFDHSAESSQNWLPSFGRVWSKGRRLQSKVHFEKEWKSKSREKGSGGDYSQKHPSADNSEGHSHITSSSLDQIKSARKKSIDNSNGIRKEAQTQISYETSPLPFSDYSDMQSYRTSQNEQEINDNSSNALSRVYSSIMPYKRKRNMEASVGNESHWPDKETVLANQSTSYNSSYQVVPYKRKRIETKESETLIQTPLLSGE